MFFEDKNNNGCITTEDQATSQADLEIIQRLLYYPFGMALEGLGAWNAQPRLKAGGQAWQQYRYNGKERDTLTGWYEYGFRWYIDGIGRFTGVDPIADRFAHVSVYNYAENRPVDGIDLHGLQYFNSTSSVGVAALSTSGGYNKFLHINRHYYPVTRYILQDIRLQSRGWSDGKLLDTDVAAVSYSRDNGWNTTRGKGQITKFDHKLPITNIAVLIADYLNNTVDINVRKDMGTTKQHMSLLLNTMKIVENARDMQLIPDYLSNIDLINFVLDSEVPDYLDQERKNEVKSLGKWLYDNREDLLKDKLPRSKSGDIHDTGYPLNKFRSNKQKKNDNK